MAGFQKVIVCGNMGKDPEIRLLNSGDRICTISLATEDVWRDKGTGELKKRTEWHRISIWGRAVEIVEKYVRKGDQLLIEGKIETRKWTDQQGQERFSTEIKITDFAGSVTLLGGRRDGASNGSGRLADRGRDDNGGYGYDDNGNNGSSSRSATVTQMPAGARARNRNDDLDDEIPF